MKTWDKTALLTLLLIVLVGGPASAEWDGGATLGLGYTLLDQTGNLAVSPETFDLYEEMGVSLYQLQLRSTNQYQLTADLENVNLDNRRIGFRFWRPGYVTISGQHQKTRRRYDFAGTRNVERDRSALDLTVFPHRSIKLFGGFAQTARDGSYLLLGGLPFSDAGEGAGSSASSVVSTDFTFKSSYVGLQLKHDQSMIEVRYRRTALADDLDRGNDRRGRQLRLSLFSPLPRFEALTFAGGFSTGWNEIESLGSRREENRGWGEATWLVTPVWILNYKLMFARTDNQADSLETDNAVSTLFLTRRFPRRAQFSLGYEFRSQDDLVERTETNAVVIKGTVRPHARLRLRGQVALAWEDDKNNTTLVGDEETTRHRWEVRYDCPRGHQFTLRYRDRRRDFADIGAEADFQTTSVTAVFNCPRWGQGSGTYSYSKGDYKNATSLFAFEQHLVSARATTKRYRGIQLTTGLTYLRSRLSADLEKIIFRAGANVDLSRGYQFNVRYNSHTYDDFMIVDRYYTANVITMDIRKQFNF